MSAVDRLITMRAMSKRRHQPTRCKVCGAHWSKVKISKRGYCYEHGLEMRLANIDQLEAKEGPLFDHWLRRTILGMRRVHVARAAALDADGESA